MAIDLAVVRHGLICLTFDDGLYEQWLPQLPLFAEYRAHVTFFFNGLLGHSGFTVSYSDYLTGGSCGRNPYGSSSGCRQHDAGK